MCLRQRQPLLTSHGALPEKKCLATIVSSLEGNYFSRAAAYKTHIIGDRSHFTMALRRPSKPETVLGKRMELLFAERTSFSGMERQVERPDAGSEALPGASSEVLSAWRQLLKEAVPELLDAEILSTEGK